MTKNNDSENNKKDLSRTIAYIALLRPDWDNILNRKYLSADLFTTSMQARQAYPSLDSVKIYRLEITEV